MNHNKNRYFKIVTITILSLILSTIFGIELMAKEIKAKTNVTAREVATLKTLDLETAKNIALNKNPSLLAVKERINQARERVSQAFSAILPSIDLNSSMSSLDYSESSGVPDPEVAYSTGISLSMVLFSGFLSSSAYDYAKLFHKSSIEAEKDSRRLLIWTVSQSFYNAQLARENIIIAKDNIVFYKRQLKEAELKKEAGKSSLSDIYNFEIKVNSGENDLIAAESEFEIALTALATLMGLDEASFNSELKLSQLRVIKSGNSYNRGIDSLMEKALKNRPDIRRAEYNIEMADKNITISKSGYYPTISLNGSYTYNRYEDYNYDEDDLQSSLSLNLNFNIFSGGATKAKVKEAKSLKKEARLNYKSAEMSLKSDLISAVSTLNSAEKKHKLQLKNTHLVRLNRDLIEKEYKAGKKSQVTLTEAQNSLIKSQFQLVQSIISLNTSTEKIFSYTGENLNKI